MGNLCLVSAPPVWYLKGLTRTLVTIWVLCVPDGVRFLSRGVIGEGSAVFVSIYCGNLFECDDVFWVYPPEI